MPTILAAALLAGRVELSWAPLLGHGAFSPALVFAALPIAVLSYIGFDAISTLNEEAKGGGRMVARATMIVLATERDPTARAPRITLQSFVTGIQVSRNMYSISTTS